MSLPIEIPGILNFRDIGGLPAVGGLTRSGVLFRSGNLVALEDPEHLSALGVRRIVDLRDDDEVIRDRSNAGAIEITRVPLFLGSTASFFDDGLTLAEMYRAMVDDSAERVVQAVRAVIETQPVLVHCTVGKDRTGVTVALALAAAGVERDAIIADYARTETMLPAQRNREVLAKLTALYPGNPNLEQLSALSPAPVMHGLLADLDDRFGSPVEFLRANGLADDEITEFTRVLVVRD